MKLALTALSIIFSLSAQAKDCTQDSSFAQVDKTELKQLIESKSAFVLDVNTEESFAKNKIPTSVNYTQIKKEFAQKLPADKNSLIVAYCGGPQCTAWKSAAKEACQLGYTNVKHYKGGIKGWMETKG